MNLIESESDDEQLVDISVDLEMSQSTQSTQSSLVGDLKNTALYSIERANQLRQILRENEEHAERKRKLDEMLREEDEKKPCLDDDENIQLDESQQNLIKNMVKNVDPLIELIPNLDEWFDLKNFNPPVYEYPSECFSDEYKSIIAKFLDDVSHRSINSYVLGFRDLMRFTTFFQLIPTQELKKQVLNCFILNSLTMKSPIAFHDISSMLEKILTSVDLACSEWYFSSSLLYQFFLSMGFCQDKFNNCFSNQINLKPINNLNRLTQGENTTDCDQDLTKSNKRLNKSMVDMILINIVQLLKNSIEIKAHYYSKNELKSIFYLICALILDKNFQSDISLLGELNSLLADLFRNEQIDLNELTDTLSNLIRLEGDQTDEKKSTINTLHHRLLFLLNALNSSRRIDQVKLLSTKLSVVILQDIFAVFGNGESQSQSRNKWDETKIELVIDSLEKHAISTFTSSSYAMSNILHAIHIIIDNYFPTLTDPKLVVAYIERLKAVFHKTNQEVRDQMSFNGRAQIKATLCHYSRLCELYLKRYQSLLTRSTSMMSSASSNIDQSDKDKENKKV